MKQIYHSSSNIHGLGLKAGEDIKKDEIITRIKGTLKFKVNEGKEDSLSNPDWVGIEKNIWIDPDKPHKFINHSCDPSAGIKGKVTMIAFRDIKEGEEITLDYSTIEGDDMWEMGCSCGSKNCRKIIRSVQFLPEGQYDSYMPYIPKYFQKLHNAHSRRKLNHG